ncbi:hypothetical protein BJP36_44040 [Moorena producens JHB]|uniref:Uncharacterized protein n=1 Tax=Moorena producens (strain JHB) TaxID=1454205 RepID=A0A9Q9STH7_MOOP1|nr:hypothetical protein [Moorena producens]WAN69332.1 hypothetical protein BJP36_44040 [Moorena producens JHB]
MIRFEGSRESGAVRPVANLIRLRKAHRGSRESGVGSGATRGEFNSPTESAPRE